MSLFRSLTVLILWAVWGVSCSGGGPPDEPNEPEDVGGAGEETRAIEVIGDAAVELGFGETATLTFRYVETATGEPAPDPVSFALEGRAGDASLSELSHQPDGEGIVTTALRAGTVGAASFRVRASAPSAANAYVEVSVGDAGFGSLSVTAEYAGLRDVWGVDLRLFTDIPCGEIDPSAPPVADRSVQVGGQADGGQWAGVFGSLAVGPSYTVLALGLGKGNGVVASGCVPDVLVAADPIPPAQTLVVLDDLPYGARGRFELSSTLDLSAAMNGRVQAWLAPATELLASGTESYLLEEIATYLAQNANADADGAFADLRDELSRSIAERLAARDADVAVVLASLGTELDDAMGRPTLGSELLLDEVLGAENEVEALRFSHEALEIDVSATTDGEIRALAPVTFASAGLVSLSSGAASTTTGELDISGHTLPFRVGTIAAAVLEGAIVPAHGAASLDAYLASFLDCSDLGIWLADQVQGACDADCYEAACHQAASDLATTVLDGLRAGDADYDALTLEGHARLADVDGDASSDALDEGVWTAHLHGALDADVSATFVGERNDLE